MSNKYNSIHNSTINNYNKDNSIDNNNTVFSYEETPDNIDINTIIVEDESKKSFKNNIFNKPFSSFEIDESSIKINKIDNVKSVNNKEDKINNIYDINLDVDNYDIDNKYEKNKEMKPMQIQTSEELINQAKKFKIFGFESTLLIKYINIFLITIIFIINNYLYFDILNRERCTESYWYDCRNNYLLESFNNKVYLTIISALILSIFAFFLLIYKKHNLLKLVIANQIILYIYDTGYIIQSFGGYVRNLQLVMIAIFIFVLVIIYLCYKVFLKNKKIFSIIYLTILISFIYFLNYYIFTYSCKDFKKGLKDTVILNYNENCVTPVPKYCSFHILDGIMDIPYFLNQQCTDEPGNIKLIVDASKTLSDKLDNYVDTYFSKKESDYYHNIKIEDYKSINEFYSKHYPIIAFPRLENINRTNEGDAKFVRSYVLDNLMNYTDLSLEEREKVEYTIEYNIESKKYAPKIDVKFNHTLSKERKNLYNKKFKEYQQQYILNYNLNTTKKKTFNFTINSNYPNLENKGFYLKDGEKDYIDMDELTLAPLTKNVLVYFTDATSRRHFMRKYSNLMKFVEKHFNNKDSKFSSYQFLKHQTIYPGTLANIGSAYFGTFNKKNGYSINKKFKDYGFITSTINTFCTPEPIDIYKNDPCMYEFTPSDHDFWAPFCEPNQLSTKGAYVDFKGPYSVLKKCMWEKQSIDWGLEYANQIFEKYKDNNKFVKIACADSHETSAEVIKYVDESVGKFMEDFEKKGDLEDTTVIIFSDHGTYSNGWIPRKYETDDYKTELNLPGLFVIIPKKVKNFNVIDKILKSKQNAMTNAFDIYKTLLSVIDGKEEKKSFFNYGDGLFYNHYKETKDKDCTFYSTKDWVCQCKPLKNVTNY